MASTVDRSAQALGAGRTESSAGRVRCTECATEQEASSTGCVVCGASLDALLDAGFQTVDDIPPEGDIAALLGSIRREIPPVGVEEQPARTVWQAAPLGLIAATVAALWMLFGRSPSPEEAMRRRQVTDAYALAGRVRAYRAKVGFPVDESTWKSWVAARTDPHLLDPWGNPYGYRTADGSFTITSYGTDGVPGGQGAAKDTEFTFRSGSAMPASVSNSP